MRTESLCCWSTLFLMWVVINGLDAIWLYFYVQACVSPNPRTAVNRTHSGFQGYEVMMYIFGFFWSSVNAFVTWGYFAWLCSSNGTKRNSSGYTFVKVLFNLLVVFPVFVVLVVMPFFGGWIVVPLAQKWAWNHRCDTYPMYAILDGKGYYDARYIPNVAHFYQTGNINSLYTFDISDNDSSDIWNFHLREWDTDQSQIPLDFYPTMQQISYNFIDDSVTANCTIPVAPGSNNVTSVPCLTGTFNPNTPLSFNLTSIPLLNTTSNPSAIPQVNTLLRTVDKQWAFGDDAPSLILRAVDPSSNTLRQTNIIRTAVTKKGDCTQLKVCLAGVPGREGAAVGAEIMAPLGLILMRQADYANECTAPSDDN
ncbi:hypothetical protein ABKN59_000299 [Abortiporus biennis]